MCAESRSTPARIAGAASALVTGSSRGPPLSSPLSSLPRQSRGRAHRRSARPPRWCRRAAARRSRPVAGDAVVKPSKTPRPRAAPPSRRGLQPVANDAAEEDERALAPLSEVTRPKPPPPCAEPHEACGRQRGAHQVAQRQQLARDGDLSRRAVVGGDSLGRLVIIDGRGLQRPRPRRRSACRAGRWRAADSRGGRRRRRSS